MRLTTTFFSFVLNTERLAVFDEILSGVAGSLLQRAGDARRVRPPFRQIRRNAKVIHALMLERIWRIFLEDETATAESKNKISRLLWLKMDTKTFRHSLQTEIPAAAFRYYRRAEPRPPFCQTVEIYAADKFGSQIREVFTK